MATNRYTDTNISGDVITKALRALTSGAPAGGMIAKFSKAAADSDGSVLRIFKSLSPNIVPLKILIGREAIAGLTAVDVGLYKPDLGAVISDNVFASALDLHLEADSFLDNVAANGMAAVHVYDIGKRLYEYAGHDVTTKLDAYDIALTLDTGGANTGKIAVLLEYLEG